ncbi:MAG: rhodanese-like domain-containing protein [Cypionkella sp.]
MSQLTVKDAITKAAKGELLLLDVRETSEVQNSGLAAGAVHIPLALVSLQAREKLAAGTPVAVYCAVGGRAGMAVKLLTDMGYLAYNIGGLADWEIAGGPVTR